MNNFEQITPDVADYYLACGPGQPGFDRGYWDDLDDDWRALINEARDSDAEIAVRWGLTL